MKYFVKDQHTNLISEKDPSIIEHHANQLESKPRSEPKACHFPILSKQPDASNFLPVSQSFSYFNQPLQSHDAASQYMDCLVQLYFCLSNPFNEGFKLLVNKNNKLNSLRSHIMDFIKKKGCPQNIDLQSFFFTYFDNEVDEDTYISDILNPSNLTHVINVVFSRLAVDPVQQVCIDPSLVPKSRFGGLLTLPNYSALSKM